MKITVLLDKDPTQGGDLLTLQLMDALAEAGHEVDCLIADDEVDDVAVKGGVRYSHIAFSNAFPVLDQSSPNLVLSSGEMASHGLRLSGYLDVMCIVAISEEDENTAAVIADDPAMIVYASELLRQSVPPGPVPSFIVRSAEEVSDDVLKGELKVFVGEVQDLYDGTL